MTMISKQKLWIPTLKFELIIIVRLSEQLYGSVSSDLIPKLKMKIRFFSLMVSYTKMKSVKFVPV